MLTILKRDKNGNEQLFEAETLHRVNPDGEQCVPAVGKFIAHGVNIDTSPSDYFEFDIEGPFGAVFVMNGKGATVAKYFP